MKKLTREWVRKADKTHDLDHLLSSLQPHHATLRSLRRGLLVLNDYAVDTRYPSISTTKRQAKAALRWGDRVRTAARSLLGIVS